MGLLRRESAGYRGSTGANQERRPPPGGGVRRTQSGLAFFGIFRLSRGFRLAFRRTPTVEIADKIGFVPRDFENRCPIRHLATFPDTAAPAGANWLRSGNSIGRAATTPDVTQASPVPPVIRRKFTGVRLTHPLSRRLLI
jgi:hypothetical protein